MKNTRIDCERLYFVLIKGNFARALVQRGVDDNDAVVEPLDPVEVSEVQREIEQHLLGEPRSSHMEAVGSWDYMKGHCFSSANAYGGFMWAYCEPNSPRVQCGFKVEIRNLTIDEYGALSFRRLAPGEADG
jgi:hypothetical protein